MTDRTGSCLCGAVRYRVSGEPVIARVCWCRHCQRIASNGTVNAVFPDTALEVTGATSEYERTADSGNKIRQRFCPRCGSQLFGASTGRPGVTVVRMGTLDDPSSLRPTINIWKKSAPVWACVDDRLEGFETQPVVPVPPTSS
jgi:hypothetical protein